MRPEVIEKFLKLLWGERKGFGEIRMLKYGDVQQMFVGWPTTMMDRVLEEVLSTWDVFAGVLLRTEEKGDAAHTEKVTEWLWCDVDAKAGATFGSILRGVTLEPQMVVDSGHGWHLYYHLAAPVPITVAQGAMKVLAEYLGGDSVWDAARIMRIPGTINHKGGDSIPVRLLRFDPVTTHRFSDFDLPTPDERRVYGGGEISDEWEISGPDAPKFGEGQRNSGLTKLAGAMLFKGMGADEILDALRAENEIRCDPPLEDYEVRNIVRSVSRYR